MQYHELVGCMAIDCIPGSTCLNELVTRILTETEKHSIVLAWYKGHTGQILDVYGIK